MKASKIFQQLPHTARESLVDCVSERTFDHPRFNALVGEHTLGLTPAQRKRLLDDVYNAYLDRHDGPLEGTY